MCGRAQYQLVRLSRWTKAGLITSYQTGIDGNNDNEQGQESKKAGNIGGRKPEPAVVGSFPLPTGSFRAKKNAPASINMERKQTEPGCQMNSPY